jgi:Ca2+-binding RTX toxin-like protein
MSQVTAVGAIANDTQEDPIFGLSYDDAEDDAGDAHRVAPYYQSPTTLVLDQSSENNAAVGNCSSVFTATLTDQFNRPIANANMDVHAKGPSEDIAFDNGSVASANRAPDQGTHTTEAARDCSTDPPVAAGQQGEHVSPTDLDVKHVESALTAGTTDAGKWSFQLFSPATGVTDFVVWSDHDDDDTFCSLEKSASGTIGWGGTAGTPALTAETPTCASPSPTSPNPGPTTPGPTPTDNPRGCTQFGTDDSDTLEGTEDADVICAGKGNDIIKGLNGNDRIYGDAGNDDIRGGAGNDNVHGGAGKDTIRGNGGNDSLSGEVGNDVVVGGGGDDSLSGQAGTDTARGGGGDDTVRGQAGPDNLTGGPGKDKLVGGSGDDSLSGGPKKDRCNGSGGQDTFSGCERKRG